jgi:flavin reductase (DIM6/NTAB) family NADH-FMN oxidoreductase RutF
MAIGTTETPNGITHVPAESNDHVQDFSPLVDSPMYVVTCKQGDESAGCLVGFATQCSIQPPRFLVCLSIANRTYRVADGASALAVHVLAGKDRKIASLFGEQTGDDVDKFAAVPWHLGITGAPILTDCAASFEGRIVAKIPFGDHVGFVLAPVDEIDAPTEVEGAQLTLRDVESFEPGHPADEPIAQRCRGKPSTRPLVRKQMTHPSTTPIRQFEARHHHGKDQQGQERKATREGKAERSCRQSNGKRETPRRG